ncbi:MgtC/SapB family protein [Microbacterium sp. ARD32]|uniref:MgtC/SapB family protein n=1 Tax=Microbacterium sp. ARD32 TaxID=2962577 RepID=UPI002881EF36|nr:MgtC/SapB family protein [Microbacterium sp. ARD32]MDT0158138.1 MgtC/SapB family protein [Microbacterium sp. ARD32]
MSLHSLLGEILPLSAPNELEVGFRVLFSLLMGACVGLERQWRAGLAGLRTNALVSIGAALFVVMGAYGFTPDGSADPTRVAAQVVSGIGFLGAGVMIREGLNIRGLNTAATLWCSAAIGCLAGTGMYLIAALGTGLIVLANIFLRPLGRVVNRRSGRTIPSAAKPQLDPSRFAFEVMTNDKAEPRVRALLLQTLSRPEYHLTSVTTSHNKQGHVALLAELQSTKLDPEPLERAVSRLTLDPKVTSARWWSNDEDEQDDEDEF